MIGHTNIEHQGVSLIEKYIEKVTSIIKSDPLKIFSVNPKPTAFLYFFIYILGVTAPKIKN